MGEQEEIRRSIRQAARNGKVACKFLLDLAQRTESPPREVGRLCDEMGLHISGCQLGCFK